MKTGRGGKLTLAHQLDSFLLTYRTTPHSTTGTSPCELLMGRSLRTRLDLLKARTDRTVQQSQEREIEQSHRSTRLRNFNIGASVMVKSFSGSGPDWVPGVIARKLGPLTYLVDVSGGRLWKRHVDHVKSCPRPLTAQEDHHEIDGDISISQTPEPEITQEQEGIPQPADEHVDSPQPEPLTEPTEHSSTEFSREQNVPDPASTSVSRRYPSRQRVPPDRFDSQTW